MADTFKVMSCAMGEVEAELNRAVEDWALHLFMPTADGARVTVVMISQRVMRLNQMQAGLQRGS